MECALVVVLTFGSAMLWVERAFPGRRITQIASGYPRENAPGVTTAAAAHLSMATWERWISHVAPWHRDRFGLVQASPAPTPWSLPFPSSLHARRGRAAVRRPVERPASGQRTSGPAAAKRCRAREHERGTVRCLSTPCSLGVAAFAGERDPYRCGSVLAVLPVTPEPSSPRPFNA
jgi:hypothetical protein